MKLLLYCTKDKPYLMQSVAKPMHTKDTTNPFNYKWRLIEKQTSNTLNGKVVAECDFEVEEITPSNLVDFEKESCVDRVSMLKYFKPNLIWDNKFEILLNTFGGLTLGYAIHIKNLKVFDEPKELNHYMVYDKSYDNMFGWAFEEKEKYKPLTKAPQNMCYAYDKNGNKYVFISIHSEWLCKIFNGEKITELRKKVLKEMLK